MRVARKILVRGAVNGAAIGLLAWFSPGLVGVGDALTQGVLDGRFALSALAVKGVRAELRDDKPSHLVRR